MGTRCGALIKSDGNYSEYYYRNWDGYPSSTGADLLNLTQAMEWKPEAMCKVLKSRSSESEGMSDENTMYIAFPGIGFERAEGMPLTDLDYFYLIDCDRKEIRCYGKMFGINPHNLASLPPYKVLKWRNPIS